MRTTRIPITGNTFPVKQRLKGLGAKWDPELKAWLVTPSKAEYARRTVEEGGRPKDYRPGLHAMNGGSSAFCGDCQAKITSPGQLCRETGGLCRPSF